MAGSGNKTCCGCLDVHTGTLLIGVFVALNCLFAVFTCFDKISEDHQDVQFLIVYGIGIVFGLIGLLVSLLLVWGNLKNIQQFYQPYIYFMTTIIAISFTGTVFSLLLFLFCLLAQPDLHLDQYGIKDDPVLVFFFMFVAYLLNTCLACYFLNVVQRDQSKLKSVSSYLEF